MCCPLTCAGYASQPSKEAAQRRPRPMNANIFSVIWHNGKVWLKIADEPKPMWEAHLRQRGRVHVVLEPTHPALTDLPTPLHVQARLLSLYDLYWSANRFSVSTLHQP
eukprot:1140878-Pelagomonas_calceolata.AAC.7